jgi:SPP1 gp7 family putative phage head morphogenesis protein
MFGKVRAARIAATEVTRLRAKANQIAWDDSGVVVDFRWSTAMDDLVCEICAPREGQLFPLSQMDSLLPAHVNCRCVGRPVVDEELARQRDESIWEGLSFD